MRSVQIRRALVALCAAAFFVTARAQSGSDGPQLNPVDPREELKQLFGKVERRLHEIDRLLSDAGAGDARALAGVGAAGIDELLKQGRTKSEETVRDIDRILELARQMGQRPSSSSGGSSGNSTGEPQQSGPGSNGKDPLGGQENNTNQRENTPSGPEQQDPSGQPKEQGGKQPEGGSPDKPEGKQPGEQGDPKDARDPARGDPRNRASQPPPQGGKDGPASAPDDRDRWGDLPVHARDVFRNEGGRDMPVRYRDWIDEYYRRLNKQGP